MTHTDNEPTIDPLDAAHLLRSYLLHCRLVRRGLLHVRQALEQRGDAHDDSKLYADEFAAFARINKGARLHPYGSDAYRAGLRQEAATIEAHYRRNRHHPEFHGTDSDFPPDTETRTMIGSGRFLAEDMTFLDIIEMVADWRGAYLAYGSQGTWAENLARQGRRYQGWFTPAQWWLITQVATFLEERVQ